MIVAFVPKDTAIAAISATYGFVVLMWSSCAVLVFAKAMVGSVLMIPRGSYTATVNIWRLILLLTTLAGRVVTGIVWFSVVYCAWCAQVAMLVARTIRNIVCKCAATAFTAAAWAAVAIARTAEIIVESATTATVTGWTVLLWMAGMMEITWTAAALPCTYCGIFVMIVVFVPKDTAIAAISATYGFVVLMLSSCAVLVFAKATVGSVLMISRGSYTAAVNIWRLPWILLLTTSVGRVVTGIVWFSVVYCAWFAQVATFVARTTWNIVIKGAQTAFTTAAWAASVIARIAEIIKKSAITATVAGWTVLLWMAGMMEIIWTVAVACTKALKSIKGFAVKATAAVWPAWLWMVSMARMVWLAATVSAPEAAFQLSQLAAFFQRKCYLAASQEYFQCMSCLELLATDDLGVRAVDCACEEGRQMCRNCQAGWVESKVGEQLFPVPCAGGCSARIGQREVKCVVDDATWRRSV